jgi:hypothetical protein
LVGLKNAIISTRSQEDKAVQKGSADFQWADAWRQLAPPNHPLTVDGVGRRKRKRTRMIFGPRRVQFR